MTKEGLAREALGDDVRAVVRRVRLAQVDSTTRETQRIMAYLDAIQREDFLRRSQPVPSIMTWASVKRTVGLVGATPMSRSTWSVRSARMYL